MNKLIGWIVGFVLLFGGLVGCAALGGEVQDPNDPLGFTTLSNVLPGTPDEEVGILPYEQITPDVADELRREDGSLPSVVLTNKGNVQDDTLFFPVEGFDLSTGEGWKEFLGDTGVQGTLFNVAAAFIPGLAAWEGILTLFSRRKKKHYGNVVKNLGHGTLGVAESLKSLGKAIGGVHTDKAEHENGNGPSSKAA